MDPLFSTNVALLLHMDDSMNSNVATWSVLQGPTASWTRFSPSFIVDIAGNSTEPAEDGDFSLSQRALSDVPDTMPPNVQFFILIMLRWHFISMKLCSYCNKWGSLCSSRISCAQLLPQDPILNMLQVISVFLRTSWVCPEVCLQSQWTVSTILPAVCSTSLVCPRLLMLCLTPLVPSRLVSSTTTLVSSCWRMTLVQGFIP